MFETSCLSLQFEYLITVCVFESPLGTLFGLFDSLYASIRMQHLKEQ